MKKIDYTYIVKFKRPLIIIIWALFFLFQKDISAQNRFNKAIETPLNPIWGWSILINDDSTYTVISGKIIVETKIGKGTDIFVLRTNDFINGNYIARLYNKSELIGENKFIIIKNK